MPPKATKKKPEGSRKPRAKPPRAKPGKKYFGTLVSNGQSLFPEGIDERTVWPRMVRASYHAIVSDLGGADACSKLQDQLARRAAALDAFAVHIESEAAKGEKVDISQYTSLCRVLSLISSNLGLRRVVLDVTPSLADLLRKQDEDDARKGGDGDKDGGGDE